MAPQPTAPAPQPPPELPSMPDVSATLTNYLRTFALWCSNGFANKMSITSALRGVMLRAFDAASSNPPVFMLEVTSNGALALAPMALGSGDIGTPVPIGEGDYLPLSGGTLTGYLAAPSPIFTLPDGSGSSFVGFLDSSDTRRGYVGYVAAGARLQNDTSGASFHADDDGFVRFDGKVQFHAVGAINQAADYSSVNVSSDTTGDAFITFLAPTVYGLNVGLNQNGYFYRGGWSDGPNYYLFWTQREWGGPGCDYRMKEQVEPLASTWDAIKALKPIKYRQKEHRSKKGGHPLCHADPRERWGFIAHELQETLGETAAHCKKDDPDVLQAVNMNMVVAALTRTVQELQARVEELEAAR
jgi:hypothetical protein